LRDHPYNVTIFDELRRYGFLEGVNLLNVGASDVPVSNYEPALMEAVKASPDVIITGGGFFTRICQRATRTIPIVTMSDDLVREKLVESFARPEGNTTGTSILAEDLDGKRQELLMEMLADTRRIGALADVNVSWPEHLRTLDDDAHSRGVELSIYKVGNPDEILSAIELAHATGIRGLNVLASPLSYLFHGLIIERTIAARIPAIFQWPDYASEGGLVSYGPRMASVLRQEARQIVKVLRAVKPADIPVEQPTKIELAINLKTAKSIGISLPSSLVARADEVIE
jgi:putative tryptophan/tyrosine transport system substrate-binding protein